MNQCLDIRRTVRSVSSDTPSTDTINRFVLLCRKIAQAHLLTKARGQYSFENLFGIPLDDLAMDSVADLFQRNEQGVLVQIQSYFASVNIDGLSDQALLSYLRRLVVAKVNQHLMSLRSQYDPSFWKVLRNIKLSIETLHTFSMVDRLGDHIIVPITAIRWCICR